MNVTLLGILSLGCVVSLRAMDLSQTAMVLSMSPGSKTVNHDGLAGSSNAGSEVDGGALTVSDVSECSQSPLDKSVRKKSQESLIRMMQMHTNNPAAALDVFLRGERQYKGSKDYKTALDCFMECSRQGVHPGAAAWSNLYLGEIYYGRLVMPSSDEKTAEETGHAFLKLAARQTVDPVASSKAIAWLGQVYYKWGMRESGCSDLLKNAVACFKEVVNKGQDREAVAVAHLRLGMQYEDGTGIARDYKCAYSHYKKAANQNANIESSLAAKLCLCDMAYAGNGTPKNYKLALSYCEPVAEQTLYPALALQAKLRRGVLHRGVLRRKSRYGIRPNFLQAREDFTDVINHTDDLNASEQAQYHLTWLGQHEMDLHED